MLTSLQCCKLGVNNLDKLVMDMGTFTKIRAIKTITNVLFFMFSCQKNINMEHFFYTF
jgi:hypothetical protein